MNSEKELFIKMYEQEHATTVKVMKAFPQDRLEYRPMEKSMSARELLFMLAEEEKTLLHGAIMGKMDFSGHKEPPKSFSEIIDLFEKNHQENLKLLKAMPEAELDVSVDFFVAPKTPGKIPRSALFWIMLHDQIHHRGQLSVLLRLVGAKVPSIYGPSADEPWM